ncbi:MAG: sulfatase [Jejuia sp.]
MTFLKYILTVLVLATSFSCQKTVKIQKKKNILLLCIDDLRPELASFGKTYIHSPNIDTLAKKGRAFHNHYVNSPSCGPSRYSLLTGTYGTFKNDAIFKRAKKLKSEPNYVTVSMPEWFKQNGYTTVSVGKVSHHPGGLGGQDWNDPNIVELPNAWDKSLMPVAEWQHPKGSMHGLANGEIRSKVKSTMDVFQSVEGEDTIYPDGHITSEALNQLNSLSTLEKPFFLAVGLIKPHLPFGSPKKYMSFYDKVDIPEPQNTDKPQHPSTWHKSGEFFRYNLWEKDPRTDKAFAHDVRLHYASCVSYVDANVGKIISGLKALNLGNNTIIVLWGDHGWNLGEHNIWGKHNLFEEALRSPLIIIDPSLEHAGKKTNAIVETVDLFPTLCDLTKIETPDFVDGVSLKPILDNPNSKGHYAYSYNGGGKTIRTESYRFTKLKSGDYELYNHIEDPDEVSNIAHSNPEIIKELEILLNKKEAIH